MIDGGGDVEVLAYVNSNLLVIHNDHSNENNKNLVKSRLIYSWVCKSHDTGQPGTYNLTPKGGFFSESEMCFSNLKKKYIPNHYPELET